MGQIITEVENSGIAANAGFLPGDEILSINGEPVIDVIDYQSLTAKSKLDFKLKRGNKIFEISLKKHSEALLGLSFESGLMSQMHHCANKCIFCFVDQMPKSCRPSLYVKDDDWRLSLIMGNYITLTNVSEPELERIARRNVSPLYISVHATDPQLRAYMLGNPKGNQLMSRIKKLISLNPDIQIHAQAVLCPGINDGKVLDATIDDLSALYPAVQSLALVPVGLTAHRDELPNVLPYKAESAREIINRVKVHQNRLKQNIKTAFVFVADEFYALSGEPVPDYLHYESFAQIEDGVGMLAQFEDEFREACISGTQADLWENNPKAEQVAAGIRQIHIAIVTGQSFAPYLRNFIDKYFLWRSKTSLIEVCAVKNYFFGESVTVAGLITGQDILAHINSAATKPDIVLIPSSMLRESAGESPGVRVFLDDMTVNELSEAIFTPVEVVNPDGYSLFEALNRRMPK